jgi:hypothetical protein
MAVFEGNATAAATVATVGGCGATGAAMAALWISTYFWRLSRSLKKSAGILTGDFAEFS